MLRKLRATRTNLFVSLNFPEAVPNSQYHFAVGDVARWPGIKRCGAAMHHGQYAAQNIHQLMLQETQGTKPKLTELVEAPPGIGIAVGKQGVAYYPSEGTKYGEDILRLFFEDDLANRSRYIKESELNFWLTCVRSMLGLFATRQRVSKSGQGIDDQAMARASWQSIPNSNQSRIKSSYKNIIEKVCQWGSRPRTVEVFAIRGCAHFLQRRAYIS